MNIYFGKGSVINHFYVKYLAYLVWSRAAVVRAWAGASSLVLIVVSFRKALPPFVYPGNC